LQGVSIKLLAVSDTKSKLIGLLHLKGITTGEEKITRTFDKCIDKHGTICFSTNILMIEKDIEEDEGVKKDNKQSDDPYE